MAQTIIIREAQPDDAQRILDYMLDLLAEPGLDIPLTTEEFEWTEASERELLQRCADSDNALFLLAEADGEIVGQLTLLGRPRRRLRHSVELGITVHRDWREQGVGSQLLEHSINWARAGGVIKRIWLLVYARNQKAIHLYRKFGFEVEGCARKAIYQDGEYLDDLIMGLLLGDES